MSYVASTVVRPPRRLLGLLVMVALACPVPGWAQSQPDAPPSRSGYVVKVPLPLVGNRDAEVIQQLRRIAEATRQGSPARPVVVLQFEPQGVGASPAVQSEVGSRGSQFERCLALARFLTDRESAELRVVAYLPASVEGHAVLPVLACQEIYASPGVQFGRAAVDAAADATVRAAYQDVVARGRTNLPQAAVDAMLAPNIELRRVSLTNAPGTLVVSLAEMLRLQEEGRISELHETVWNGHGLALFTAEQMRSWLWISPTVKGPVELAAALGVEGGLRSVQHLPRQWNAVSINIRDSLNRQRVNQIIRGLQTALDQRQVNLVVLVVDATECDFDQATRLASWLVEHREQLYSVSFVQNSLAGPISLLPVACHEAVLIGEATLSPSATASVSLASGGAQQRVLDHLASTAERPLPLLAALADHQAVVTVYTHQGSGRREIFTDQQVKQQLDRDVWLPRTRLVGGEPIPQAVALEYGLVNAVVESTAAGLMRLGLTELPPQVATPWLDASIQKIIAQPWVPRILLLVGMMALMIELGNPGISLGGLIAGLCFLGYFWIEALNGNVEWLEILLFLGGLFALAIELFVLPGFGIFGITGLMMIFISLVLAGQTFVWPRTSGQLAEIASNLFWVAFLAFSGMVGLLLLHRRLESLPLFRWLSLQPGGTDALEELEQREAVVHLEHLLGQVGMTTTRLNPSGKAQFGMEIVPVVGSGGMIDSGAAVQVVEVRGNLVIVEEVI